MIQIVIQILIADQTGGPKDPFVARYELKIDDSLHEAVKERNLQQEILKWRKLGRLSYVRPKWEPDSKSQSLTKPVVIFFLNLHHFIM